MRVCIAFLIMKQVVVTEITVEELLAEMESLIERKFNDFKAQINSTETGIIDTPLTGKDAAKLLGVAYNTFKGFVLDGLINPIPAGGKPRYSIKQLTKLKETWSQEV